jgi:hypothetical protein
MAPKCPTLHAITCVGNNIAKKHICLSIEIYFGIFYVFGINPKYSYTIMYECEKSSLRHELIVYWTIQFFSFKFVSCKGYL